MTIFSTSTRKSFRIIPKKSLEERLWEVPAYAELEYFFKMILYNRICSKRNSMKITRHPIVIESTKNYLIGYSRSTAAAFMDKTLISNLQQIATRSIINLRRLSPSSKPSRGPAAHNHLSIRLTLRSTSRARIISVTMMLVGAKIDF